MLARLHQDIESSKKDAARIILEYPMKVRANVTNFIKLIEEYKASKPESTQDFPSLIDLKDKVLDETVVINITTEISDTIKILKKGIEPLKNKLSILEDQLLKIDAIHEEIGNVKKSEKLSSNKADDRYGQIFEILSERKHVFLDEEKKLIKEYKEQNSRYAGLTSIIPRIDLIFNSIKDDKALFQKNQATDQVNIETSFVNLKLNKGFLKFIDSLIELSFVNKNLIHDESIVIKAKKTVQSISGKIIRAIIKLQTDIGDQNLLSQLRHNLNLEINNSLSQYDIEEKRIIDKLILENNKVIEREKKYATKEVIEKQNKYKSLLPLPIQVFFGNSHIKGVKEGATTGTEDKCKNLASLCQNFDYSEESRSQDISKLAMQLKRFVGFENVSDDKVEELYESLKKAAMLKKNNSSTYLHHLSDEEDIQAESKHEIAEDELNYHETLRAQLINFVDPNDDEIQSFEQPIDIGFVSKLLTKPILYPFIFDQASNILINGDSKAIDNIISVLGKLVEYSNVLSPEQKAPLYNRFFKFYAEMYCRLRTKDNKHKGFKKLEELLASEAVSKILEYKAVEDFTKIYHEICRHNKDNKSFKLSLVKIGLDALHNKDKHALINAMKLIQESDTVDLWNKTIQKKLAKSMSGPNEIPNEEINAQAQEIFNALSLALTKDRKENDLGKLYDGYIKANIYNDFVLDPIRQQQINTIIQSIDQYGKLSDPERVESLLSVKVNGEETNNAAIKKFYGKNPISRQEIEKLDDPLQSLEQARKLYPKRTKFIEILSQVLANPNNYCRPELEKGVDPRLTRPDDFAIGLKKFLGEEGLNYYLEALVEEKQSKNFREAVLLHSIYRNGDKDYIFIDGGKEREVCQMRQLVLTASKIKGYSYIQDLHDRSKMNIKSDIKSAFLQTLAKKREQDKNMSADVIWVAGPSGGGKSYGAQNVINRLETNSKVDTNQLNLVIPCTFTSLGEIDELKKIDNNYPFVRQVFCEVEVEEATVTKMITSRSSNADFSIENTNLLPLTVNNLDIGHESKPRGSKYVPDAVTGLSYDYGVMRSRSAGVIHKSLLNQKNYFRYQINNKKLNFYRLNNSKNDYILCSKDDLGMGAVKLNSDLVAEWGQQPDKSPEKLQSWIRENRARFADNITRLDTLGNVMPAPSTRARREAIFGPSHPATNLDRHAMVPPVLASIAESDDEKLDEVKTQSPDTNLAPTVAVNNNVSRLKNKLNIPMFNPSNAPKPVIPEKVIQEEKDQSSTVAPLQHPRRVTRSKRGPRPHPRFNSQQQTFSSSTKPAEIATAANDVQVEIPANSPQEQKGDVPQSPVPIEDKSKAIEEMKMLEARYQSILIKKGFEIAKAGNCRFDPQGHVLVDVLLTKDDLKELADNDDKLEIVRNKLNVDLNKSTICNLDLNISIKSYDKDGQLKGGLDKIFYERLIALLPATTSPDDFNEIFKRYVALDSKGSIIPLQEEIEMNARAYHRILMKHNSLSNDVAAEIFNDVAKEIESLVLETMLKALLSFKKRAINIAELNQKFDAARPELATKALAILTKVYADKDLLDKHKINALKKGDFEHITASGLDYLRTNARNQTVTRISATEGTAHAKQLSQAGQSIEQADRRLHRNRYTVSGHSVEPIPGDAIFESRIPSIAIVEAPSLEEAVNDVNRKLTSTAQKIKETSYQGPMIYNLLTSLNSERYDASIDRKNRQRDSAHKILLGAHKFNLDQISQKATSLWYVQNIPVNQHTSALSYASNDELIDEATLMSEMALLQTIKLKLDIEGLNEIVEKLNTAYTKFLESERQITLDFFAQSTSGKEAIDTITRYKLFTGMIFNENDNLDQLIAKALLKMVSENQHFNPQFGMLIQAFSVFIEPVSQTGCKSANERYVSVSGRVDMLKSLLIKSNNITPNEQMVRNALVSYLETNTKDNALSAMQTLQLAVDTAFNAHHLYGAVTAISLEDQHGPSKVRASSKMGGNITEFDTNVAETSYVSYLQQESAKKLQVHKSKPHVRLQEAVTQAQKDLTAAPAQSQSWGSWIKSKFGMDAAEIVPAAVAKKSPNFRYNADSLSASPSQVSTSRSNSVDGSLSSDSISSSHTSTSAVSSVSEQNTPTGNPVSPSAAGLLPLAVPPESPNAAVSASSRPSAPNASPKSEQKSPRSNLTSPSAAVLRPPVSPSVAVSASSRLSTPSANPAPEQKSLNTNPVSRSISPSDRLSMVSVSPESEQASPAVLTLKPPIANPARDIALPANSSDTHKLITEILVDYINKTAERFVYDKSARSVLKNLGLYTREKGEGKEKKNVNYDFKGQISEELRNVIDKVMKTDMLTQNHLNRVALPLDVLRHDILENPIFKPETGLIEMIVKQVPRLSKNQDEEATYSVKFDIDPEFVQEAKYDRHEAKFIERNIKLHEGQKTKCQTLAIELPPSLDRKSIFHGADFNKEVDLFKLNDEASIRDALKDKSQADRYYQQYISSCLQEVDGVLIPSNDYLKYADRMIQSFLYRVASNKAITIKEGIDPLMAQAYILVCKAKGLTYRTSSNYDVDERVVKVLQDRMNMNGSENIITKALTIELDQSKVNLLNLLSDNDPNVKKAKAYINQIQKGINLNADDRKEMKDLVEEFIMKLKPEASLDSRPRPSL